MVTRYKGLLGDAVDDWITRLPTRPDRPWQPDVDHPMIVQPTVDPGYAMPNAPMENLNSMPGAEVQGALPVNVTRALQALIARGGGSF
jgi:hypothetical protein